MKTLRQGTIRLFFTLFICLLSLPIQAGILDTWHWRSPSPFVDTMRSVTFGAGKFVAVGDGGVIHTSSDGAVWDAGQRPVSSGLNQVVFINGQFIAVGNSGAVVTSSNGVNWTARVSGVTNNLLAVTYGGGQYIACGVAGQLARSADGISWAAGTNGNIDLPWITFGNGVFVTAASGLNVSVSSDGQNWATEPIPFTGSVAWPRLVDEVAYGNGMFLAVVTASQPTFEFESEPMAFCYQSTDGTNWVQNAAMTSGPYGPIAHCFLSFFNGQFQEVACYNSFGDSFTSISRTTDGASVNVTFAPTNAISPHSMTFGNGQYVLVRDGGQSWISSDETNWTAEFGGILGTLTQMIRGSNNYLVFTIPFPPNGPLPVVVSSDGLSFTIETNSPNGVLGTAAFDGTNYVAVGTTFQAGHPFTFVGEVYTSTDATNWIRRTSNANQPLNAVCRGPDRWIAVGGAGTIITSPSTLAWTLRSSGTANNLTGVAFGNGTYVAAGSVGTVVTSSDGVSWDVQFSGTTSDLADLRFFNGQFFAVGANGTIINSSDGINWTNQSSGTATNLSSITYGFGTYLVCGSSPADVFLASSNGINWQDVSLKIPTINPVSATAFLNNSFWIMGQNGMILQSDSADGVPHLFGPTRTGNGGIQLKVSILPAAPYRVQFRTNLLSDTWHDVMTNPSPITSDTWTDTNAPNFLSGFYRVVSP